MKTQSIHFTALLPCAVVMAMAGPLRADDAHVHIKIPNPIPKIVKGIKRVSERVGDIVVRTAERIESEEELVEARRAVPPSYPPPPPGRVTVSIEPRRPPVVPPPGAADPIALVPYESVRGMPRPNPPPSAKPSPSGGRTSSPTVYAPAEVRQNAGGTAVISAEAALRTMAPSIAVSPSATVSSAGAGGQVAAVATGEKPTPPPEHPYGKPVPGRPGLVYPPGMKEIPENMIDVRGITPGTKVRDPVTKMVFRVP